jgi:hypothetical protein
MLDLFCMLNALPRLAPYLYALVLDFKVQTRTGNIQKMKFNESKK